jgi:hypothetical protein
MGTHRRDLNLTVPKYILFMFLLTMGVIACLMVIGTLVAIAVLYHIYWGIACIPAGILIGLGVSWAMEKYGR